MTTRRERYFVTKLETVGPTIGAVRRIVTTVPSARSTNRASSASA
jgi:hypothetical protein